MLTQLTLPHVESSFTTLTSDPWQSPGDVAEVLFDPERSAVVVQFAPDAAGVTRVLLLEVPHPQVIRLRFDPRYGTAADYSDDSSRAIVMDSMRALRSRLRPPVVTLRPVTEGGVVTEDEVLIAESGGQPHLRLVVHRRPFRADMYRPDGLGGWFRVVEDASPSVLFRPAIDYTVDGGPPIREYQVIKRYRKPATAQYMGFGEKVGYDLTKNGKQLTYINFDNWAHNRWYGAVDARGFAQPSDDREPLYNANLFFLQYNGTEPRRSVLGLLADSTGPAYMDIAASFSDMLQIGTLYDNLDVFHYSGEDTQQVLRLLTEFVGRARLKPRYGLGYHQGC